MLAVIFAAGAVGISQWPLTYSGWSFFRLVLAVAVGAAMAATVPVYIAEFGPANKRSGQLVTVTVAVDRFRTAAGLHFQRVPLLPFGAGRIPGGWMLAIAYAAFRAAVVWQDSLCQIRGAGTR